MDGRVSLRQSNKGFTLIEICVVMALISILAAVTTMSLIRWQEYSTYKTMEDNAELIYMAAKNKIAQLKSDNTFKELKNWGSKGTETSFTDYNHTINGSPVTGPVYYFSCNEGDYDKYTQKKSDANKTLWFDLLCDYLHDKKILKANIVIEYGEDGTIYTVYYSDRTTMGYDSSSTVNLYSSQNKTYDFWYENVIGIYSIK